MTNPISARTCIAVVGISVVAFVSVAGATPATPLAGPLDLRVDYTVATRNALAQRALKQGSVLGLEVSLLIPKNPQGIVVELLVTPSDGELTMPGALPFASTSSAIEPGTVRLTLDLSSFAPGSRFIAPATFVAKGTRGSGVLAMLRTNGPGGYTGAVARILAVDPGGTLVPSSSHRLGIRQRAAIQASLDERRRLLFSDRVLPFDPRLFPDAMKVSSPRVGLLRQAPGQSAGQP